MPVNLPIRTDDQFALGQATIEYARTQVGQKEAHGDNDDPWIRKIQLWASGIGAKTIAPWLKQSPYCAEGTCYSIYQASVKTGIKTQYGRDASTNHLRDWSIKKGLYLGTSPEQYSVGFLHDNSGNYHHTFLCSLPIYDNLKAYEMTEAFVFGIDFNWSQSCCRTMHPIRLCSFARIA